MESYDRCKNCGKPVMRGFKFCTFCGAEIVNEPAATKVDPCTNDNKSDETDEFIDFPLEEVVANEKPNLKSKIKSLAKNDRTRAIFMRSVVVAFCAIMFVLSFCPIYKFPTYVNNLYGEIFPTDFISLFPACTRNYDYENDKQKIDDLADRISDLTPEYEDGDVINVADFNREYKEYSRKTTVATYEYMLSFKDSTPLKGIFITTAISALLNIIFTFIMFAASIISLIKLLTNKDSNLDFVKFSPLYLFLPIIVLLSSSLVGGALADSMIITLILASISIVALLVRYAIKRKEEGKLKLIIPKIVTVATIAIIVGCLFAPALTVDYKVESDEDNIVTFRPSIDHCLSVMFILDESTKEKYDNGTEESAYDYFAQQTKSGISYLPGTGYNNQYGYNYMGVFNKTLSSELMEVVAHATNMKISYKYTGVFSVEYFVLPIAVLCLGFAMSMAFAENKTSTEMVLIMLAIILLVASLICTATINSVSNQMLYEIDCDDIFSTQIGGGIICAVIFSIALFAFQTISKDQLWLKTRSYSKNRIRPSQ